MVEGERGNASQRERGEDRRARRPGGQQAQDGQALHSADLRRQLRLRAQPSADRRGGAAGRDLRATHPRTSLADRFGRGRARLQATQSQRALLPRDEDHARDPTPGPPTRGSRPRARVPLHARLLRPVRAPLASPMLFCDDNPIAPADPVAPARRSPDAIAKAGSARTPDGHPADSLEDLLSDLATLCRTPSNRHKPTLFTRLTTPTELQADAYALINIKPA